MSIRFSKIIYELFKTTGIYQKRCINCMTPFIPYTSNLLCPQCQKLLAPYKGPRCYYCGIPTGTAESNLDNQADKRAICHTCVRHRPLWQAAVYHGLYNGALRDLCLRLKFDGQLYIKHLFAQFLMEVAICIPRPDMILSIPQHPANLRKRGYNQAHEIAKAFAKLGDLKLRNDVLARIKCGVPQEGLNAMERHANLRHAFKASKFAEGQIIWLIDDVMTTGSTYSEACAALLEAGAKEIYAIFIARTPLL